jgi:hypothetical protein
VTSKLTNLSAINRIVKKIRENKKLKKDIDFIKKELEGLKEMITNINKVEEK